MSVLEFYVSRQVDPDFDPDSALESGLQEWFLEHPDAYWAEGETYVEHLVSKSIAERLRPAQPIAASARRLADPSRQWVPHRHPQ